jgi:hypothetical protein
VTSFTATAFIADLTSRSKPNSRSNSRVDDSPSGRAQLAMARTLQTLLEIRAVYFLY